MTTVSGKRTSRAFYPIILVLLLVILGLVLKVVWERKAMQKKIDEVVNRSESADQEMAALRTAMKGLEGDTVKAGPTPLLLKDLKAITDRADKADLDRKSIWKQVNASTDTAMRLSTTDERRLKTVEAGLKTHIATHPTSSGSGAPRDAVTPAQLVRSVEAAKAVMRKERGSSLNGASTSGLATLKKELTQKIYDVLPVGTILPFDPRRRSSSGRVLTGSTNALPTGWKYLERANGFPDRIAGRVLMATASSSDVGSTGGTNSIKHPRAMHRGNHKRVLHDANSAPKRYDGFSFVPLLPENQIGRGTQYVVFGPEGWRGWRDTSKSANLDDFIDITPAHIHVRYIIKVQRQVTR